MQSLQELQQIRDSDRKNIYKLKKIIDVEKQLLEQLTNVNNIITDNVKEQGITSIILSYVDDIHKSEIHEYESKLKQTGSYDEEYFYKVREAYMETEGNNLDKYFEPLHPEKHLPNHPNPDRPLPEYN